MSKDYSPLSQYKALVKEFNLTEIHDLAVDQKLAFLQAQRQELINGIWRESVNVLHALRLQTDSIEALAMKGNNNIVEHKNAVRQFAGGVKTIDTLIKELEAEA